MPWLSSGGVVLMSAIVFVIHALVHWFLLKFLVPVLGKVEEEEETATWTEVAQMMPDSWFTTNPVHCLRSKYIYKHDPPCTFYTAGKGHLVRKNSAIGVSYSGRFAEAESYSDSIFMAAKQSIEDCVSYITGTRTSPDWRESPRT